MNQIGMVTQSAVHLRDTINETLIMSRPKDETLSIRTSAEIKRLLRVAAERERRSVASMIEILVLEYARKHDLKPERQDNDPTNGGV